MSDAPSAGVAGAPTLFFAPVPHPTVRVANNFGQRRRRPDGSIHVHKGIDIWGIPAGTPVIATLTGTVTRVIRSSPTAGNALVVSNDHGVQRYLHLNRVPSWVEGDRILAGSVVGGVGATGRADGVHLHYEEHSPTGRALNPYARVREATTAALAGRGPLIIGRAASAADAAVLAAPTNCAAPPSGVADTPAGPQTEPLPPPPPGPRSWWFR